MNPVDMPLFESELRPSVHLNHPEYSNLGDLLAGAQKEEIPPKALAFIIMSSLVIETPYLIPGLGVYRIETPALPEATPPRHGALQFVAATQQHLNADVFAVRLADEASRGLFDDEEEADEEPAGFLDDDPGTWRLRLVPPVPKESV
tara:strand:+ start:1862 stop:2302 length:441 start_codon:yes stop_codon:yes gene_type:complete